MITIANCSSLDEALGLRALLSANGIEAFIPDEATASVLPHHFITKAGVRLQVAEEQADEARLIIGRHGNESG